MLQVLVIALVVVSQNTKKIKLPINGKVCDVPINTEYKLIKVKHDADISEILIKRHKVAPALTKYDTDFYVISTKDLVPSKNFVFEDTLDLSDYGGKSKSFLTGEVIIDSTDQNVIDICTKNNYKVIHKSKLFNSIIVSPIDNTKPNSNTIMPLIDALSKIKGIKFNIDFVKINTSFRMP